jgi:hypothetical protein
MFSMVTNKAKALALIMGLALTSNNAFATLDANAPGTTNIDSYDVDLNGGSLSSNLNNINQLNLTGFVLSDFGTTGAPSITGSLFTDYIVLNVQTATTSGGGTQSSCLNSTCEVTVVGQLAGQITDGSTGAFTFTGVNSLEFFLDTGAIGADAELAFGEYFDGTKVMTGGSLVSLTAFPGPVANTGALSPSVGAGGSFNFQNRLLPVAGQNFLLNSAGTQSLFNAISPELLFGLTEGQITLQALKGAGTVLASSVCASGGACTLEETIMKNFIDHYSIAATNTLTLSLVQTSPTLNIASRVPVPEPESILLLGLGLALLGAAKQRREVTTTVAL